VGCWIRIGRAMMVLGNLRNSISPVFSLVGSSYRRQLFCWIRVLGEVVCGRIRSIVTSGTRLPVGLLDRSRSFPTVVAVREVAC